MTPRQQELVNLLVKLETMNASPDIISSVKKALEDEMLKQYGKK